MCHVFKPALFIFAIALQHVALAQVPEALPEALRERLESAQNSRNILSGMHDKLQLLIFPKIEDELQLSNEQLQELKALKEDLAEFQQRGSRRGTESDPTNRPDPRNRLDEQAGYAATVEVKLKSILNETQLRRLDELEVQHAGARALTRPDIAKKMELSTAQRLHIHDAQTDFILGGLEGQKSFGHACYAILNDKQREIWSEMTGPRSSLVPVLAAVEPGPIGPAAAPRRREPPPSLNALQNPVVRAELQVTDEQFAKLNDAFKKFRSESIPGMLSREQQSTNVNAMQAFRTTFDEVLSAPQKTRLQEIDFQQSALQNLLAREFRDAAMLTNDQINSLDRLIETRHPFPRPPSSVAFFLLPPRNQAEAESRQETLKQALAMLSDTQREVWDRMAGKPLPLDALFTPIGRTRRSSVEPQ